MEEKDFQRIEEMMYGMMGRFRGEIAEEFRHQLGAQREDFQHKLDLVVEGQQMLSEKMDRLEGRMGQVENCLERVELKGVSLEKKVDGLERKVDGISADLTDHRRDTEAHRNGWRVREE